MSLENHDTYGFYKYFIRYSSELFNFITNYERNYLNNNKQVCLFVINEIIRCYDIVNCVQI